ncbi:hypothetical protein EMIHUDRAFT_449054 [Emiliania huxleyi CCMP1516]|uniref:AB hydrolase-1 domain-containing protein n=2 Tax=Emiliania huxleyi TaxID=2903 RepID=A0A0D3KR56_EMIH1|nr:hypothetical protein EMIHUDRAFT_449054 [Emiliania huxleyi CCMP1516]EOD38241.1 hypothetical protein EMIHUDRAFT_449054 [Emiliania huxleyi CCMP1516]|eukprot:XP_005790670.1 hypothetical protein EMIHUDRAFT_449054 [Emiliania huxleyi CCMP1516]
MAMNPAERHFSADADAAIAALRRSRRVPYGGGLHSSSCTVPLPGVAGAELLDELRTLLGWPLDGEVPLALDDATEGVRRLLTLLYPRLPASDEGYWSEADCRLIARQAAQTLGYAAARRLLNALGLESRFGDAPGCRLHWYDSGAGGGGASAPPLLLIHGMFTTGASLAPLALLLRSSRRVDLLGHSFGANVALELARQEGAEGAARTARLLRQLAAPLLRAAARLVRPALLGVFVSPNTVNLWSGESYLRLVRRRHAATPLTDPPCNLIFAAWDGDDLVAARPADGLRASFPTADVTLVTRALHQINVLNPATVCECVEAFEARRGCEPPRAGATLVGRGTDLLRRGLAALDRLCGVAATQEAVGVSLPAKPRL